MCPPLLCFRALKKDRPNFMAWDLRRKRAGKDLKIYYRIAKGF